MRQETTPVTVRLDRNLRRSASAISKVTGESFRELVERGLRNVVDESLKDSRLANAVDTINSYGKRT